MGDPAARFRADEILLTGANGFVGKVVLAMLLDRFPDGARVHVLIRPRDGLSAPDRFDTEVLDSSTTLFGLRANGLESRQELLSGLAQHDALTDRH